MFFHIFFYYKKNMNSDKFTGVYREYHDEEKTEIKSEVFIINGKKRRNL